MINSKTKYFNIVSEPIQTSAQECIEDELDLQDWEQAKAAYEENSISYSLKEVMEEFGIK